MVFVFVLVLPAVTAVRDSDNRDEFGRGVAGGANGFDGETIASQAQVFLTAPIRSCPSQVEISHVGREPGSGRFRHRRTPSPG
jgi:hypothetical protein